MTPKQYIKSITDDTIEMAFVLTAIEKYSKEIIEMDKKDLDNALFNGILWKVIAEHTLNKLNHIKA